MIPAFKKLAQKPLMAVFLNLVIAVFLGLWLRWGFVGNLPLDFTHLRHAHSHTALLGWVYLALFLLIAKLFHPEPHKLKTLFWLTQLSVLGMLFSFPFQGYAAISIAFSTLHIILSYIFAAKILKLGKHNTPAGLMLKLSLWFMVISTIGVWTLGPIMASGQRDSPFYFLAIQFFLHFQFNGWFITALLAILLKTLEKTGLIYSNTDVFKGWVWVFALSVVLGFALPIYWEFPQFTTLAIFATSSLTQFLFFLFVYRALNKPIRHFLAPVSKPVKLFFYTALISLSLKLLMQVLAIFPSLAASARWNINFTVGFIHLILLGIVTSHLLFFLLMEIHVFKKIKWSIWIFVFSFFTTEILIFANGLLILNEVYLSLNFHLVLLVFSIGFPLAVLGISIYYPKGKNKFNVLFKN